MNFFAVLKLVFSLLPIIHSAIDQIEALFPLGGYGVQKLDMVKNIIEKAMSVSDLGGSAFTAVWPMIAGIVGDIVSIKNSMKRDPQPADSGGTFLPKTTIATVTTT